MVTSDISIYHVRLKRSESMLFWKGKVCDDQCQGQKGKRCYTHTHRQKTQGHMPSFHLKRERTKMQQCGVLRTLDLKRLCRKKTTILHFKIIGTIRNVK